MIGNLLKFALRPVINRAYMNINHDALYREWYHKHSKRLLRFKDIHKGKDCFIIGNGPSLNKMDLRPLKNYYTFGLNKIYLMNDKVDLNLSYHVAVNPLVIEQSAKELEKLQCPSFLPLWAHSVARDLDMIFFILTGAPISFQNDITRKIYEGHTVTYVAMQIAYFMGFKRVFLIGVDHFFITNGGPNERQFHDGPDPNHFDPNYFGGKEWYLPDLEGSEIAYRIAKFCYERAGREITDVTVDGKLNIFPKLFYEQALDICGKKYD